MRRLATAVAACLFFLGFGFAASAATKRVLVDTDPALLSRRLNKGESSNERLIYSSSGMYGISRSTQKSIIAMPRHRPGVQKKTGRSSIAGSGLTTQNRSDYHKCGDFITNIPVCSGLTCRVKPTHIKACSYQVKPLAEVTVYQFGGPEIRSRCINYGIDTGSIHNPFGDDIPGVKTCTEWATDVMQHGVYVQMWGPDDMDKGQLEDIKNACFLSAAVSTLPFFEVAAGIDSVLQTLVNQRPVLDSSLQACLKTTEFLGRVYVPDFRLEISRRDFW